MPQQFRAESDPRKGNPLIGFMLVHPRDAGLKSGKFGGQVDTVTSMSHYLEYSLAAFVTAV